MLYKLVGSACIAQIGFHFDPISSVKPDETCQRLRFVIVYVYSCVPVLYLSRCTGDMVMSSVDLCVIITLLWDSNNSLKDLF